MKHITMITVLVLYLFGGSFDRSDDYKKGLEEYDKGNIPKAVEFYKKACDGGESWSCFTLGNMYSNGEGIMENDFKAFEFFKKACDSGESMGCILLGSMYHDGIAVKQNKKTAKELFGKACDGQNVLGCKSYTILNEQGY